MTKHERITMDRSEFIQLVRNQLEGKGCPENQAGIFAEQAMSDFEESERCTVGDPDYVWGEEGAEIMADEYIQSNLTE